jgi:hypothetical protein
MKTFSMLFAALIVGLVGSAAHAADAKLKVVKSLPLGHGGAQIQSTPSLTATPFYSNISTFSGSAFTFGGTFSGTQPAGTSGLTTAMSCDDLSLNPGDPNGSYTLNEVSFSASNVSAVDVTAAPSLLFYDQASGAIIDGVVFNPVTIPANSVQLFTANLSSLSPPIAFPLDANGEANIWMCQIYDDAGGTTGASLGDLDSLGAGLCDPPTVGSSPDNIYLSDTPILSYVPLPSGIQGNFGGSPVANYCDELAE